MSEQKQSSEEKHMFVESLMTKEEWNRRMKAFPESSHIKYDDANKRAIHPFKWRLGMGDTLSSIKIGIINRNLDEIRKKANL